MTTSETTTPIPVAKSWISPNNRVLIYGHGNTYKTSMALRMAVEASLNRIKETGKKATLSVIMTEGNMSFEYIPSVFGSKLTCREFLNELAEKGLSTCIWDIFAGSSKDLSLILRELRDATRENHLVVDDVANMEISKNSDTGATATLGTLADLFDTYNGLVIGCAHSGLKQFMSSVSLDGTEPQDKSTTIRLGGMDVSSFGLILESSVPTTLEGIGTIDGVGKLTVRSKDNPAFGQEEYYRLKYE